MFGRKIQMTTNKHKAGSLAILAAGFILLAGLALAPQSSFAQGEETDNDFFWSKLRATQDGEVISVNDMTDNTDGLIGLPVDCVGGIEKSANADMMKCYLLSDEGVWAKDYKSDPTAIVQEGSPEACPEGAGFESNKQCFLTTFDGSNFASQGDYRFVAEFYAGDTLLDVETHDYRLQSFFVLPESAIGAIALVGSSLAVFGAYRVLANRNPDIKAT
jgi:hypothetical protein